MIYDINTGIVYNGVCCVPTLLFIMLGSPGCNIALAVGRSILLKGVCALMNMFCFAFDMPVHVSGVNIVTHMAMGIGSVEPTLIGILGPPCWGPPHYKLIHVYLALLTFC